MHFLLDAFAVKGTLVRQQDEESLTPEEAVWEFFARFLCRGLLPLCLPKVDDLCCGVQHGDLVPAVLSET